MLILIVMCLGILYGCRFFPEKYKKANERLQVSCTMLLIFSMGVKLGNRENFLEELLHLGTQSFLFFLIPTALSVFFVYFLTRRLLEGPEDSLDSAPEPEGES